MGEDFTNRHEALARLLEEQERKDPDFVFNYGLKVLTGIKGEPLTNLERRIFRACVEDSYGVVSEQEQNFAKLEEVAEDLFYVRYFGAAGYREIPGVNPNVIEKEGWETALGKYWRNKEVDKVATESGFDPHNYNDDYYKTFNSSDSGEERDSSLRSE